MSNSVVTSPDSGNTNISVNLRPDIAQEIYQIATKLHLPVDTLVNEILQHYVAEQAMTPESNGATFLLSLAGIFHSGTTDTSENSRSVIADFILQKHEK